MKNILKILGAAIVFGFTIISGIISFPYNLIIGAISASFFYFYEPILSEIKDYRERSKEIYKIKETLINLNNFLRKYTHFEVRNESSSAKRLYEIIGENFSKEIIVQEVLDKIEELKSIEKDALLITFLVDTINREKDNIKNSAIYKETISQIIEKYDYLNDNNLYNIISQYYFNYINSKKLNSSNNINNYEEIFNKFISRYCKSQFLSYKLKLDQEETEELRRTLAILYTQGKLSTKLLGKDLFAQINNRLEKEMGKSKIFLLIANKYQKIEEIDKFLNKIPNLRFGKIYPNRLPDNLKFLHMRILYPPKKYEFAEKFLQRKIIPKIDSDKIGEGHISIIPIEGKEIISFPDKIEKITNENVRKSYNVLKSIKTGNTFNLTNLILDNLEFNEEKDIKDLLSIIPFNIFLPNLEENIKNFIISNYEEIKEEFKIKELIDWANIKDYKKLGNKFIMLDEEKKKRLCQNSKWMDISKEILKKSKNYKDAILGFIETNNKIS